jgi:hypothetical protein
MAATRLSASMHSTSSQKKKELRMADIGKPLKRVRTYPLTEPVPDDQKEPIRKIEPVKTPEKEPVSP